MCSIKASITPEPKACCAVLSKSASLEKGRGRLAGGEICFGVWDFWGLCKAIEDRELLGRFGDGRATSRLGSFASTASTAWLNKRLPMASATIDPFDRTLDDVCSPNIALHDNALRPYALHVRGGSLRTARDVGESGGSR